MTGSRGGKKKGKTTPLSIAAVENSSSEGEGGKEAPCPPLNQLPFFDCGHASLCPKGKKRGGEKKEGTTFKTPIIIAARSSRLNKKGRGGGKRGCRLRAASQFSNLLTTTKTSERTARGEGRKKKKKKGGLRALAPAPVSSTSVTMAEGGKKRGRRKKRWKRTLIWRSALRTILCLSSPTVHQAG